MRSSIHALSPESTVTSLLSSSGHLSLQPSALSQSFCFRDKEYSSASAALDAYITDFERRRHGNSRTGAGLEPGPSSACRVTLGTLRNRDVLRERLSERELDFLSLPVSSLHHHGNRDRLSMTTDELLNLPNDGSMPITHTTAFIHGILSRSRLSHSHSPVKSTCCQSHAPSASHPIKALYCPRCGEGVEMTKGRTQLTSTLQPDPRITSHQGVESASAPRSDWLSIPDQATMHLPHWLSSNKAAVDCSDIHSLPELPYPPWLQHCQSDQSQHGHDQGNQSEQSCKDQGRSQAGKIEDNPPSAPSWVLGLEDEHQQLDNERSLKSLRLQFAEHISHLASGRTHTEDSAYRGVAFRGVAYRERTIQSLIQKADRVLDSLQNSATGSPVPESSAQAEELTLRDLELDLSQTDQVTVKLPPVSMEDYKQVLFRLEALETELHRRQGRQQGAAEHTAQDTPHGTEVTDGLKLEVDDSRPSLQRALLHLHRLKLLVEKSPEEDEGRYSSSSTEPGINKD